MAGPLTRPYPASAERPDPASAERPPVARNHLTSGSMSVTSASSVDPRTPVVVGVGQCSDPIDHPGTVAHVPMDGFHLADVELRRLGRRDRKGAPDTFDADGYLALLHRLRTTTATGPVYAPAFDREIEQPVAGSIPVPATCRLVVSEGNYLLLEDPAWRPVRAAFDEVWFHETDEALRLQRLAARHVAFGKSPDAARAWVRHTDEPNARLVERSRDRADVVVACADLPA